MATILLETRPAPVPAESAPLDCSTEGCRRTAVVAMRFHLQGGHVHECAQHAAELREWCDVAESAPLPCPWDHGTGITWTDIPRELT